ncbi:MAG: prepilin peptidase [Phycisphaeraceae bacterium]|nr:prepilin peptidase [Phycisphaeraceae bacterium]
MADWYMTLWQHDHVLIQWLVVAAACLIAAASDVRCHRIPNVLTGTMFLAGLVFASNVGGWAGLADALVGALVTMLPFVLMFIFVGGGAGDAKLMAAVGAWTGLIGGLLAVIATLVAGGLCAVLTIVIRGQRPKVTTNMYLLLTAMCAAVFMRGRGGKNCPVPQVQQLHVMPYGPAIFLGVCVAGGVVMRWQGLL